MSIEGYIAKNLQSGKYQLLDNDKSTGAIWSIYSIIIEESGSVLDGFIYCKQCKELIKYGKKNTSYAYRHKCYTQLKANEGDGNEDEEMSATTQEQSEKTDDDSDSLSDDSHYHVEKQIKKGVYKLREKRGQRSNVWTYFKTIHRKDGSQIDKFVWCRRCKKLTAFQPKSTSNLCRHKCVLNDRRQDDHPLTNFKINEDATADDISKENMLMLSDSEEAFEDNTPSLFAKNPIQMDDFDESETSEGNFVSIIKIEENNIEVDDNIREEDQQLNDDTMWEEDQQLNSNEELNKPNSRELERKLKSGVYKLMRNKNSRAMVWRLYDKIETDDGKIAIGYVSCRNCRKLLKFNGKCTSNLNRHKCYVLATRSLERSEKKILGEHNKDEALNICSLWIYQDNIPCNLIEGKGLRTMLKYFIKLGSTYGEFDLDDLMPDSKTVKENIHDIAEKKKAILKQQVQTLCDKQTVTVELWSDCYVKRHFFSIWLHYPKNNELNNIRLGTKSCDIRVNSTDMSQKIEKLLGEFGVWNMDNIVFVSDTQSAFDFPTIICSNYLFATVLDTAIERTVELQELIGDCKTIVQYCRKNEIKIVKSDFCKAPCGLNYALIKCIGNNWQQVQEVLGKSNQPPLETKRLSTLSHVVRLCQKFEVIFKKLQASRFPSLCFVIPSINIIKSFCEHQNEDDPALMAFKTNILSFLEEFWVPHIDIWHKAACFLYPPANKEQVNDLNEIKDFCIKQITKWEQIVPKNESSININSDCPTPSKSLDSSEEEKNLSEDLSFFFPSLVKKSLQKATNSPAEELTRYSMDYAMIDENFNAIHWWQQNSGNYPRLSKLALRILSIPASKADIQMEFDIARSIITEESDKFTPEAVDNMLFLNCMLEINT